MPASSPRNALRSTVQPPPEQHPHLFLVFAKTGHKKCPSSGPDSGPHGRPPAEPKGFGARRNALRATRGLQPAKEKHSPSTSRRTRPITKYANVPQRVVQRHQGQGDAIEIFEDEKETRKTVLMTANDAIVISDDEEAAVKTPRAMKYMDNKEVIELSDNDGDLPVDGGRAREVVKSNGKKKTYVSKLEAIEISDDDVIPVSVDKRTPKSAMKHATTDREGESDPPVRVKVLVHDEQLNISTSGGLPNERHDDAHLQRFDVLEQVWKDVSDGRTRICALMEWESRRGWLGEKEDVMQVRLAVMTASSRKPVAFVWNYEGYQDEGPTVHIFYDMAQLVRRCVEEVDGEEVATSLKRPTHPTGSWKSGKPAPNWTCPHSDVHTAPALARARTRSGCEYGLYLRDPKVVHVCDSFYMADGLLEANEAEDDMEDNEVLTGEPDADDHFADMMRNLSIRPESLAPAAPIAPPAAPISTPEAPGVYPARASTRDAPGVLHIQALYIRPPQGGSQGHAKEVTQL
ncbi:uncharacterized protein BXZ73DRAFT_107685 [Epithele typhae]|uniref:uncharacterized protein n=1 Tax=Epithele typhae TaxID=378194 RepID=UPI00200778EB|nr:uncharacterized protein BXZ73DRAFT_107685 [Epithele typhae]KAH9912052.1 hypothetical protein BXZ73DRAFT_107685 [Epithele typhae]